MKCVTFGLPDIFGIAMTSSCWLQRHRGMLTKMRSQCQMPSAEKRQATRLPGGPFPTLPDMVARRLLGHPERLVHLTMRIATRDTDVTQSCIAQTLKLVP
jgi:hypothetical protein